MTTSNTDEGHDRPPSGSRLVNPPGSLEVLGWTGELEFSTPGSLFFRLWRDGRHGRLEIGWLEIHYPCDPSPRVQIQSEISQDALARFTTMDHQDRNSTLEQGVIDAFHQCGIPRDESYCATFFTCKSEPLVVSSGESEEDEGLVCWS